ncbi:MAG: hypothetical protein U9P79_05315 [Candidatus Cloacimonadota bacterium]|nr:hypothetical protein [Candidatus Cloacimonadota bacterium]
MIKKFIELYTKIFFHLFLISIILVVSSGLIFLTYYSEKRIERKLANNFSSIKLLLYLEHNINRRDLQESVGDYLKINNMEYTSGGEAILELEKANNIQNLSNWVNSSEIPDVMIFNFSGKNFSTSQFLNLTDYLSSKKGVKYFDYNQKKLTMFTYWNDIFYKYRLYPFYLIIILAGVMILLIRLLIRIQCRKKWLEWKLAGSKHLYKIWHLILEFFYMLLFLLMAFLLPLYFWRSEILNFLYVNSIKFNSSFYYVFGLIGLYFIISLLNLIGDKKS